MSGIGVQHTAHPISARLAAVGYTQCAEGWLVKLTRRRQTLRLLKVLDSLLGMRPPPPINLGVPKVSLLPQLLLHVMDLVSRQLLI